MKEENKKNFKLWILALMLCSLSIFFSILNIAGWQKERRILLEKSNIINELTKMEVLLAEEKKMIEKLKEISTSLPQPLPKNFLPLELQNIKVETREIKKVQLQKDLQITVIEWVSDDFDLANLPEIMKYVQQFYPLVSIKELNITSSTHKPGFANISLLINTLELNKN